MNKSYGIMLTPDLQVNAKRDAQGRIVEGLAMDDITSQNQALLTVAAAGEFKAWPTTGVGAMRFLRDDNTSALIAEICSQLRGDGQKVIEVKYTDNLLIDAHYES
ncbi:MAG: hypothetical protein IJX68_02005 [Rikenellaceae bacterium]|nr:hypothetical protein [Rikenellaceae bacterium]